MNNWAVVEIEGWKSKTTVHMCSTEKEAQELCARLIVKLALRIRAFECECGRDCRGACVLDSKATSEILGYIREEVMAESFPDFIAITNKVSIRSKK